MPLTRFLECSSNGISSWTPLKPQHSNPYPNPNPNPLANQLLCIDFLTPPTPLIIPHRLSAFLESLMLLKNWCSIHVRCSKSSVKHSIRFCGIFSKLKTEFYCISFFLTSRWHFWNSPAVTISRVYSNCCCSCSFEPEIIKIGQSSHKMYSNNILNFQESMTILNARTKKSGNLLKATRTCSYLYYFDLRDYFYYIVSRIFYYLASNNYSYYILSINYFNLYLFMIWF